MNILIGYVVNNSECPSKLTELLQEIEKNPARAHIIERDAHRFVDEKCGWIQHPCPPMVVDILLNLNIPKGPIGIITEFMYHSKDAQIKSIIRTCKTNYEKRGKELEIFTLFNEQIEQATCFIPEKMPHDPLVRMLSLMMYANEKININIDECELRGTIAMLGITAIRRPRQGDCCTYSTVGEPSSCNITGDANKNLATMKNALLYFTSMEKKLENKNLDFKNMLATVLQKEISREVPFADIIEQICYVDENFNSVDEIRLKFDETKEQCEQEKRLHVRALRMFIRDRLMKEIYLEAKYPRFAKHVCALCEKEAYMTCPCKTTRYCSTECQKIHWRRHRKKCTGTKKKHP